MTRRHAVARNRRGFSLVEVTVSTCLVVILTTLLSNAWSWLGRPLVQSTARCRIAQEADLALACLSRDLGGCLPEGSTGQQGANQFVGWTWPGNVELMLCFDSNTAPNALPEWAAPDTVVVYQLVNGALVRSNLANGVEYVAARNVDSFFVEGVGADLQITLTFAYRGITTTYTMIAKSP